LYSLSLTTVWPCNFLAKEYCIGAKAAHEMLMKLTTVFGSFFLFYSTKHCQLKKEQPILLLHQLPQKMSLALKETQK